MSERFLPMLAVRAEPFDSEEYLFEVKWDGIRALAANEDHGWRLWGRDLAEYQQRYPELDVLAQLPMGTVLDGELVLFTAGLPDLNALLGRHQRTRPAAVDALSRTEPVSYVVFDALFERHRCLWGQPLTERRKVARQRVEELDHERVVFAEGVVGSGRAFFAAAVQRGQEGVMAKHVASQYFPGRRSPAWKKIKPVQELPAVIIGYEPGRTGVSSLLVAAPWQGNLRYVARLRRGLSDRDRTELAALLAQRRRPRPILPCPHQGVWVEPELYCRVRFLGWTANGRLRSASFAGLTAASA